MGLNDERWAINIHRAASKIKLHTRLAIFRQVFVCDVKAVDKQQTATSPCVCGVTTMRAINKHRVCPIKIRLWNKCSSTTFACMCKRKMTHPAGTMVIEIRVYGTNGCGNKWLETYIYT